MTTYYRCCVHCRSLTCEARSGRKANRHLRPCEQGACARVSEHDQLTAPDRTNGASDE